MSEQPLVQDAPDAGLEVHPDDTPPAPVAEGQPVVVAPMEPTGTGPAVHYADSLGNETTIAHGVGPNTWHNPEECEYLHAAATAAEQT